MGIGKWFSKRLGFGGLIGASLAIVLAGSALASGVIPGPGFLASLNKQLPAAVVVQEAWNLGCPQNVSDRPTSSCVGAHLERIPSIAFSADGQWLASASTDNSVKIWDVAAILREDMNNTLVATLPDPSNDDILAVAFSPDPESRWLATGGGSADLRTGSVTLWDWRNQTQRWRETQGCVYGIAFSADGQWLASGDNARTIQIRDVATGTSRHVLTDDQEIQSVAFSPVNSDLLVSSGSGGMRNTVKLWDLPSEEELTVLGSYVNPVYRVAFSPDGRSLAFSGRRSSQEPTYAVGLWGLDGEPLSPLLYRHDDQVRAIAFSPNGRFLISGAQDGTVKIWDLERAEPIVVRAEHGEIDQLRDVLSVAFSPDNRTSASSGLDHTIKIRQLSNE